MFKSTANAAQYLNFYWI